MNLIAALQLQLMGVRDTMSRTRNTALAVRATGSQNISTKLS